MKKFEYKVVWESRNKDVPKRIVNEFDDVTDALDFITSQLDYTMVHVRLTNSKGHTFLKF